MMAWNNSRIIESPIFVHYFAIQRILQ
jgi:hypothetical protein